jgi:CRISPR-associated protein Cas5t
MRAVKVVLDGVTTSFRYPHFVVGRHPTFPLPPPSTVYGHIASALGYLPEPQELKFAYSFRYEGVGDDVETLHIIQKVLTGRRRKGAADGEGMPPNIEVQLGPIQREMLLFPHLELYITAGDDLLTAIAQAMRCPAYPVVLGRSQDLCAYRSVKVVELHRSRHAYYEGALLPWEYRLRTTAGIMFRMPRFVDPDDRTNVQWGQYLALDGFAVLEEGPPRPDRVSALPGKEEEWVDPDSTERAGRWRAVVWQAFTE